MSAQASEPSKNTCEQCGKQFNDQDELHQHKTDFHRGQTPPPPTPPQ